MGYLHRYTRFGVLDLIGNTPIVDISGFKDFRVLAKCELYNPSGSHKDRVYYHMIKGWKMMERFGLE
jgi:cysteine synthase